MSLHQTATLPRLADASSATPREGTKAVQHVGRLA